MASLASGKMKSTTLENNVLEAALRLQVAEIAFVPPTGTAKPNRVQITINDDTGIVTIAASLEVLRTIGTDGAVTYTAKEYITEPPSL